ncbi:MAG: hypothetical protein NZL92_04190 [Gloeomargarita sp. SKYG116]|nr:hypothetical protein [Gloeomargarita sp. SKYG116]MCS7225618.1 hypothetical protein [Gloeomargarita sp. SKYB31]MDW8400879.1 hypothetical protein [Gloeomargarita sp. SKYGB_i_bin116]
MQRGRLTAILTGAAAILLGVLYLLMAWVLDSRGPLQPAPASAPGNLLRLSSGTVEVRTAIGLGQ